MRAVFLDRYSLDQGDIDFTCLDQVVPGWRSYPSTTVDTIAERVRSAEIIITNKVPVTAQTMRQAYSLKLICVAATGCNNVDLAAAAHLGIPACNVRAYATHSVAEHVFAMILQLSRHLTFYQSASIDGRWAGSDQFCVLGPTMGELAGKKLGIIGYGELGRRVAQLAQAFDMRVYIAERKDAKSIRNGRTDFYKMLAKVDMLTLHCPLATDTFHLIGAAELALMPNHASLINTARGGIVDELALADALRSGTLAGAAVDVLTREPPLEDQILLQGIPNLIVTPHVAWAGQQSRQRLVEGIANNIAGYLSGRIRNRVN